MTKFINKQIDGRSGIIIVLSVFLLLISAISFSFDNLKYKFSTLFSRLPLIRLTPTPIGGVSPQLKDIEKFATAEEFKSYLADGKSQAENFGLGGGFERSIDRMGDGGSAPERVSETNVQVQGIDEPDIVKTDGKEIYFSSGRIFRILERGITWEEQQRIMPPYYQEIETKIIKAFPPADLAVDSEIKAKSGDLLLSQNVLLVFSAQNNEIFGYDVANPKSPKEKWKIKLEDNTGIVGARLYKDKVYLVAKEGVNEDTPCPIRPLTAGDDPLIIECKEIYHPIVPVPADAVFSAMILDPVSGKIEKNISFVGSSGTSVVYMSESSIYITYNYLGSVIKFYADFFKDQGSGLIPASLQEKIEKLESYDISQQSKMFEFQMLLEKYFNSLSADEILKIQNELNNRLDDYYKLHQRDLGKTGIVKINVSDFQISASGKVPGFPLNNFALDEHNGKLRIAVTVGDSFGGFGLGLGRGESVNDVYVLDNDLKILGKVLDLGLTERIYSVRFIAEKGYVVTFRRTDPFYVLDLSDPENPQKTGELKIPGYSSYLHPLDAKLILGIGQEGSQVKISLFDVSDAKNPKELDKYLLDEYWTEVANNYHAFLLDTKHNIFFLPGGKGGYVFSYKAEFPPRTLDKVEYRLELKKAVSQTSVKRAVYINDYLYIIGDDKITVLNELNWERVKELELNNPEE